MNWYREKSVVRNNHLGGYTELWGKTASNSPRNEYSTVKNDFVLIKNSFAVEQLFALEILAHFLRTKEINISLPLIWKGKQKMNVLNIFQFPRFVISQNVYLHMPSNQLI
jgi:hypothetical protein